MRNHVKISRLLLGIAFSLSLTLFSASDAQAQLKAGVGLAYGADISKIGIQFSGSLPITEDKKIRAAPDLIFFAKDDFGAGSQRWWEINLNGNYVFMNTEQYDVYGIGGINIVSYNVNYDSGIPEIIGFDASQTKLGLNVGGGGEYYMNFGVLYGEVKYTLSDFDQLVLSAGARISIGNRD